MDKQSEIDILRRVSLLEDRVDGLAKPEIGSQSTDPILMLSGLRGYWPMSVFDGSGNAEDLSGRGQTLGYNGNPQYSYEGLTPFLAMDGTGDWLGRAYDTGLTITGTEAFVANPGLTIGGWYRWNSIAATGHLGGKLGGAGNYSYRILQGAPSGVVAIQISVDGTAIHQSTSITGVSTGVWYLVIGVFIPSGETTITLRSTGVNEVVSNTTSVPASIFNANVEFRIGSNAAGGNLFNGDASRCFVCCSALDATVRANIFNRLRASYGV